MSILALSIGAALAGPAPPETLPVAPLPHPKARDTRNAGVIVAAPGLLAGGAGLVALYIAGATHCEPECPSLRRSALTYALVGGLVSTPLLAVGLPLWVTGNQRLAVNDEALILSVGVVPTHGGGRLQLSARF